MKLNSNKKKLPKVASGKKELKDRKKDYQLHHLLIQETIIKMINQLKRVPTRDEIGKACGLSNTTIDKHFEDLKFTKLIPQYRILTPLVVAGLFNTASKQGRAAEAKLWMQIIEGWTEKFQTDEFKYDYTNLAKDPKAEPFLLRLANGEDPRTVIFDYEQSRNTNLGDTSGSKTL